MRDAFLPHDDRAGRSVAEALPRRRAPDQDRAEQVGDEIRDRVDDPQDVADDRGAPVELRAIGLQDADPQGQLSEGGAQGRLEDHEIRDPHELL